MERNISVLEELEEFIVPLSKEAFKQLELNLCSEGCRDPLVVWERDGRYLLIDGHNRLKICQKHGIPYKLEVHSFKDIKAVRMWMINNQLGRRNLNALQLSYYRGVKYESIKKNWGGKEYTKASYQKDVSGKKDQKTSDLLADEFKVSRMTIHRDARFARGLDRIGEKNPALKRKILSGETKIKKSVILLFSSIDENTFKTIRDEADLLEKADFLESQLKGGNKIWMNGDDETIKSVQQPSNSHEQLFEAPNQRIQRLKGTILSAINQAIEKKNHQSMEELKGLIEKLESLLLQGIHT